MDADSLEFPAVYFEGMAFILEPSMSFRGPSAGYFGGPTEAKFTGITRGAAGLHRVLTLQPSAIPALAECYLPVLPLFYGLRYSGCEISYSFSRSSECRIIGLDPRRSSEDWPYVGFPEILPYFPLRVKKRFACSARIFSKLSWQGVSPKPKTMMVIVPPPPVGGVSLWGRSGDLEGVQIIFECDFGKQTVKAYNQCG
jgi:hypothetical protein